MASPVISLVLSTKSLEDKTESMSVSDINPQATNQQIIDFADMLMGFSTNSLMKVSKVTKEEVYNNA